MARSARLMGNTKAKSIRAARVADHITVTVEGNDRIAGIVSRNQADVAGDTLADAITCGKAEGYTKEWDVDGETVTLGVQKV